MLNICSVKHYRKAHKWLTEDIDAHLRLAFITTLGSQLLIIKKKDNNEWRCPRRLSGFLRSLILGLTAGLLLCQHVCQLELQHGISVLGGAPAGREGK